MFDIFKRKPDQEDARPWSERLASGLARSREKLAGALSGVFTRRKLDAETLEELETALLTADVGVAATQHLLDDLSARWKRAAGDTFRAAAREQLAVWGERNGVTVISQTGGDAGAVMFDAIGAARARGIDVVLADTAGRLPTQLNLMEEIRKVQRVIRKADASAPHEVLLVLDANTGQNALAQVKAFDDALGLTGLVMTKLDGSAKGGVVAAIAKERPIPLRFIGVGEGLDDLKPFVAGEFVDALVD